MNEILSRAGRLNVSIGGTGLSKELRRSVSLGVVRQSLGFPAVAEIDFADAAEEAQTIAVGADIRIGVGDGEIFSGRVASMTLEHHSGGGRTFRLRAYDSLERLRARSRIRRLENTSVAEIARELAGEVGLAAGELPAGGGLESAIQRGESDLEFLLELGQRTGVYPLVEGGRLDLVSLEGRGDEIELVLGRGLIDVRLSRSAERSLESVEVSGWDPITLESLKGKAAGGAEEGAGSRILSNRLVSRIDQSDALAESAFERGTAFGAVAEGSCVGDPDMAPGRAIRLAGVGEGFAGRYVVTTAVHRFDAASRYRTEFSTSPPSPPPGMRGAVVTLGRVLSIDDPDKRGRCKVALPGFDDVEAGWLHTVVAGAGRRKGMVGLPEPDDDVLVIFPEGDLAHGFVLGGLFGTRALPPGLGAAADRPFVIRTGAGQTLELSGKGSSARLSTRGGSVLEFSHDRARLAAASDLVIEAPGKRIVIRADAVDFERG